MLSTYGIIFLIFSCIGTILNQDSSKLNCVVTLTMTMTMTWKLTLLRKCRIMPEITLLTVDKIRQENQADSEKKTKQEPQKKRT
jgi:hypothetical protein